MPFISAAAIFGGAALSASQSRAQASKSLRFQREMAQSAHQYEVEDLRLAGLNPILSGTGGPGAKASGGAQAPIPDFASLARGAARVAAEVKLLNEQSRGAQFKADIDGPAALIGRLATDAASKIEKKVKSYKYVYPPGQQAIRLEDEKPTKSRKGYKGKFKLKYDDYGSRRRSRQSHGY